jgi:hypothetical protein
MHNRLTYGYVTGLVEGTQQAYLRVPQAWRGVALRLRGEYPSGLEEDPPQAYWRIPLRLRGGYPSGLLGGPTVPFIPGKAGRLPPPCP